MSDSSNALSIENHQAQKGQHMVDYVDADAVDFEPLTKSVNGAATTPHYRYSSSSSSSPSSSSKQESQFQSVNIDQDVENDVNHNTYHSDRHRGSKYSYSVYNQITNLMIRCIPQRLKPMLNIVPSPYSSLTSSELSLVSSLSICMIFFALVVLSGFISNSIGSLTQSSGVNVNQKSSMNVMKHGMTLQNSKASGGHVVSYQGVGLAPPLGTRLPPAMEEVFANVDDLPMELMDTAIFWHSKFFKMSPFNIFASQTFTLICQHLLKPTYYFTLLQIKSTEKCWYNHEKYCSILFGKSNCK
jgi:hypothetical protein